MKLKVSYSDGTTKEFEIDRIRTISNENRNSPVILNLHQTADGKFDMKITANLVPNSDASLEKIEFVS
jgi:hypothetical protein